MGPLKGIRIIEIASIGPGPFAGMMLADMGAEVIRVERPGGTNYRTDPKFDCFHRGKRCIAVDLKSPEGVEVVLKLAESSNGIFEGNRPGVAERLGIGPEDVKKRNPSAVYGRMTGWGQEGPLSQSAGHDINYISVAGALNAIGEAEGKPQIPMALVGDFGGGGLMLAFGMVCALLEAKVSGKGQVVDAAIVDGAATLMAAFYAANNMGAWGERGTNVLDSGAHYYNVYQCADGQYVSVGAMEPQFYSQLLDGLGLADEELPAQMDKSQWLMMKQKFTEIFKSKSRDQWQAIFADKDACFTPVISMTEAYDHPHIIARQTMVNVAGYPQPGPAPRFSRTQSQIAHPAVAIGQHTDEILSELGLDFQQLKQTGAVS